MPHISDAPGPRRNEKPEPGGRKDHVLRVGFAIQILEGFPEGTGQMEGQSGGGNVVDIFPPEPEIGPSAQKKKGRESGLDRPVSPSRLEGPGQPKADAPG